MRGRNRLVPRLLGITRESVLRVDENTKEVLKSWPLTTVRRWAASPNSFTLDFGDYSESFYSVQTTEGEAISQLIAMYIDIIMQKKKPLHPDMPEEEDEPVVVESRVDPNKATMMTYHPSRIGQGQLESIAQPGHLGMQHEGSEGVEMHGMHAQHGIEVGSGAIIHNPASMSQNPQLMLAQQNVSDVCRRGISTVDAVMQDLTSAALVPTIGSDSASLKWKQATIDVSRQNVSAALAAMLASTASVITQTGVEPEEINYTAVGSAVTTISTNLTELAKAVKMLAALAPNESDSRQLLDSARMLAIATAKLLDAALPENLENRQNLLASAGEMGQYGGQLLLLAGDAEVDVKTQESLVTMAKAVAAATAALVTNARNVAAKCDDPALQNQVIVAAKQTALATQSLIACTKVLAPSIDSHLCQQQLIEACKLVASAVEKIVQAAQAACGDDDTLRDLGAAATAVTEALNSLIEQIKQGVSNDNLAQYDETCEAILSATDKLFSSMGNPQEMVKQAKILAEATSSLVNAIKFEAQYETDSDNRRRLLDAAKVLADATSKMVEAAKLAAKNPQDEAAQEQLRIAAEQLRAVTNGAASSALKKKAIKKLEASAKQAAAVSTQLIAAAQGAKESNRNESSQLQLLNHCKVVAEQISDLVQAVRTSINSQESPSAQLGLINASQALISPAGKMVAAAKAAVPTVGDQAAALQLGNFAKATASALAELRSSAGKAQDVCGCLEIDSAIDVIKNLAKELVEAKREAQQGQLFPLPGQSVESCSMELGATSKTVGSSMAQLLTAANQGNENYTGIASRDTANSLRVLTSAIRGVASFTKNPQTQEYIIVTGHKVMDQSVALISEAKQAVQDQTAPNKQLRLAQAAKAVSQALNHMVNCLPGVIDFENAIKAIAQASLSLQEDKFPSSGGQSYHSLQSNLTSLAAALNVASTEVVSSARGTPEQQASVTAKFSEQFQELLNAGLTLAGATKRKQNREDILGHLRTTSVTSSKLLLAAKALSVDPTGPNVQNQLAAAARAVTDSINALLNQCSTSVPGQRECDNALRKIEALAPLLDTPNEPQNDLSYFDCLDIVAEKSKVLGEAGSQITLTAKKSDYEVFGQAVELAAATVCQLTEAAAQAAYLVGVADPSSVAAVPGLVDQMQFARAQQAIQTACSTLSNPTTQEQVLSAAAVIAKHTGTLCNACKLASSRTTNPVAKKQFVQAAKDVASTTANLVKNIKVLAADVGDENARSNCCETVRPLLDAVEALTTFASSPQFISTPAKISAQARVAQEPIVKTGKSVITSSTSLLSSAKSLAVDPSDVDMWKLLAQNTKAVTDSVKALLLAIKDRRPGQKECDDAIDTLNETITKLDQAVLAVMSEGLHPNASTSLQGFQEQMLQSVGDIKDSIHPLCTVAKGEAEKLGHHVSAVANFFPSLAAAAIGASSRTVSQKGQISYLEESKTLCEACMQLMYAAKESGGNSNSVSSHEKVDEGAQLMFDAAEELTSLLEKAGAEAGLITGMLEEFSKAKSHIDELLEGEVSSYAEYKAAAIESCTLIVKSAMEMKTKANSEPSEIVVFSRSVTDAFKKLVDATQGALATTESDEIASYLRQTVFAVGEVCEQLIRDGAIVQGAPDDKVMKHALADQARIVAEKVQLVLQALKAGAVGTQACEEAVGEIKGVISDLETSAMFATAGALDTNESKIVFTQQCYHIVETAKGLVEDTKRLVSSAGGSQEQLAEAARFAVKTIQKEADHVKLCATSLTSDDVEAQLLLLNAVRDVAKTLEELVHSTRIASGKSVSDPAMEVLKTSAKNMVSQVSSLMKTVKNVEDEAARGVKSLESTIQSIEEDMRELMSNSPAIFDKAKATPEALVDTTKSVTLASQKTVLAGNSCKQIDLSAAANLSRKAVHDLLVMCKSTAEGHAQTEDMTEKVKKCGEVCAEAYLQLLRLVHDIILKPSSALKDKLPDCSKKVADALSGVVKAASELKQGAGFVDMTDPQVRAEQELLAAAVAIEAAAKKLSELTIKKEITADANLKFDEQILYAAKSIASATKSLVQSARATQRELVDQGKLSNTSSHSQDSLWSEGLVSAAKLVAEATSNLCDAANQVVLGNADENKLIAAAKAVAANTAQLLHAAQVKADPSSENNRRLQIAGSQVKKATETLVKAAEESIVNVNTNAFGVGIGEESGAPSGARQMFIKELEKQEQIARKRRELEALEQQLVTLRRHK